MYEASLVAQMIVYLQCRRSGFNPWVGKIPCRRAWQSTPVFLPGGSHRQRSLVGYSPWGSIELDMTETTHMHTHFKPTHNIIFNDEKLKIFPLRQRARWECSLLLPLLNIAQEVIEISISQEKEIKVNQDWKEEVNYVPICRWHDVYRNLEDSTKKLL